MVELNDIYTDKNSALKFINDCEAEFENILSAIAKELSKEKDLRCVTLSGPTCSGKTTAAAKLTGYIEQHGRRARVISVDDFYYDEAERIAHGTKGYEGADSINTELFASVISDLINGRKTCIPTFDFKANKRITVTEYTPHKNDLYIFEGIQTIYPEITDIINPFGYKSIYISVADDVNVCETVFSKHELRLMRRTVRDIRERATPPNKTMHLWDSVRENEETNIFPYVNNSDYVINSFLPYEILAMAKEYIKVTDGYKKSFYGSDVVLSLRERLKICEKTSVDVSMIPINSVFREFVG